MLNELASDTKTLTFSQTVKASPAQAYKAFTNGMMFREWLSDNSLVDARENGALFLSWNAGYYAAARQTLNVALQLYPTMQVRAAQRQIELFAREADLQAAAFSHSGYAYR